ncbi:NAD(P)-dependent oxidoreductase [Micrococcales bacterium 31B]|nr:NAD(P)-dependent oxidoreductase [Micrococcales bacterium 31B]
MKIVVIGASGHIGTYLVPRLVRVGHEVVAVSRGMANAYLDAPEWNAVTQVRADRAAEDAAGTWGPRVAAFAADAVIDLICFTPDSAQHTVDHLRGHAGHLVHCGSIWRYGVSHKVPITESQACAAAPLDEYGRAKRDIAELLQRESRSGGLTTTSLHPGHIVGPGWEPIGPLGNLDPTVWEQLARGDVLQIPGSGAEAMHHVHADDVAQAFELAVSRREAAAGEDFNIVSPAALTVRGFAEIAAGWFGREANLRSVGWEVFSAATSAENVVASRGHLERNHSFSIDKARQRLGYAPRYESDAAVFEALTWLWERGRLEVPAAPALRGAGARE